MKHLYPLNYTLIPGVNYVFPTSSKAITTLTEGEAVYSSLDQRLNIGDNVGTVHPIARLSDTLAEANQTITGNRVLSNADTAGRAFQINMTNSGQAARITCNADIPQIELLAGYAGNVAGLYLSGTFAQLTLSTTTELRINGTPGTAGQHITSNGAGATPTWSTPPKKLEHQVGGQYALYTDRRWVATQATVGYMQGNQSGAYGTGADPTVSWNALGVYVEDGAYVDRLRGAIRINADVTSVDISLIHHTGPSSGIWSSNPSLTTTEILRTSLNPGHNGWFEVDEVIDHTTVRYGFLILYMRPTTTPPILRYVYGDLRIHVETAG